MTSSIPMFTANVFLNKSAYFENCITDPDGFIEKIKTKDILDSWENCNPNSKDCFDVKLYHARNNLYSKNLIFENTNDLKKLYILNSIKMAFWLSSDSFSQAFGFKNNKNNTAKLYRQDVSSLFNNEFVKAKEYTAILFLNESSNSTPTTVFDNGIQKQIMPKKGSILLLSPDMYYDIGYFNDVDRYYVVYNFKADII